MKLVVTGGGTGGHLFPGIALATGMQKRIAGSRVLFIGTSRQLDKDTLKGYDFDLGSIECMGLKGMGLVHRIKSVMKLFPAVLEAGRILAKFKPDLVFGVGGYVTGPVLLAAKIKGYPVCIHEQNSVPGLANKILSRIVDKIFISIPCSYSFSKDKTVMSGNPVRQEIIDASVNIKKKNPGELTVLVLGGSQGAHRVNMLVQEAAEKLKKTASVKIKWLHQTGKNDLKQVESFYCDNGINAQVSDFFLDMADAYRQADLVVSRAGATTLAELSVMGLPALLIPFPFAADNHQETNALYYEKGGAAEMYPERDLEGNQLAEIIQSFIEQPGKLEVMASNMKKMGKPNATDMIIDECLKLVESSQA